MSKSVKDEILGLVKVDKKRGDDEQAYMKRVVAAVTELADVDWDKLSDEAQAWFNDAVDRVNDRKEIIPFLDEAPAQIGRAHV